MVRQHCESELAPQKEWIVFWLLLHLDDKDFPLVDKDLFIEIGPFCNEHLIEEFFNSLWKPLLPLFAAFFDFGCFGCTNRLSELA
jgi:hypothetical protein